MLVGVYLLRRHDYRLLIWIPDWLKGRSLCPSLRSIPLYTKFYE
jgi:hypothetical protein